MTISFGYLDIGAEASIELPAPADWGVWALTARVHVLLLGDNTRDFNGGDDFEVIASVGVEVSY